MKRFVIGVYNYCRFQNQANHLHYQIVQVLKTFFGNLSRFIVYLLIYFLTP